MQLNSRLLSASQRAALNAADARARIVRDSAFRRAPGGLGGFKLDWTAGGETPSGYDGGLGDVQDTSMSNTFLDTLSKTFDTLTQGGVQYVLNKQAIQAGQPIVGTTQGTVAPVAASATPSKNTMLLGVAAGLAGLFIFMRAGKRR